MIVGFSNYVKEMINRNFKDSDKFNVIDETKVYRKGEDESVWQQARGREPSIAEVWFNGEFLCDVRSDMQPDEALALIQYTLLDKLKVNKS